MSQRSQRPAPERHARSRLAQLITQEPFLRGSLVERSRPCGKPTCRCQRGQLHRSLYLACRHRGRRALLYVPRALEDTVRQWVDNGRSLSRQLQDLNQLQLDQLLLRKRQLSEQRAQPKAPRLDRVPMMSRFCRYVDKCYRFGDWLPLLNDARQKPHIPCAAVFASVFALFASNRTSLNSLEKDLIHFPARLRGLVGPQPPSIDTIGRVYSLLHSAGLRQVLTLVHHRLKRNKALADGDDLKIVALDGHEFFKSRKRCCAQCQRRTLTIGGEEVVEYYHQGVVCHLSAHRLAVPLDVELLRPGEGEETAAKRLLERVLANYPRYFNVVCGDALYFDAPFLNFCLEHGKHALVVVKGDGRLLLQDARGLFCQQQPGVWQDGRRTVRYHDAEGFTTAAGVKQPLRVVHTEETVRRRERVAGQWREKEERSEWYWATTLSKRQMPTRRVWHAGHGRWDVENDCFNTLAMHWGLDHCFQHSPAAIVNFVLTLFLAYVLLQCFWERNLKTPMRAALGTLLGLAEEVRRGLGPEERMPWYKQLARAP